MKKSEMSKGQLDIFYSIIKDLEDKGWEIDGDLQWFEEDLWVEPELVMKYNSKQTDLNLLLEYTVEGNLFTFTLTSKVTGKESIFDIFPEKNIQELLNFITIHQDKINSKNFQDYLKQILEICPKIITYVGDNAYQLKNE